MKIVFMGTPDFAVPSLKVLHEEGPNFGFEVVGVITSTDKLGGRGKNKVIQSAVKKYAVEANLPVLQPKNLKAPEFIEELKALKADLQVVVAFRMLPVVVWDMPSIGTINLHGSLLPQYRGAAPINWAVINGETETGVTTFFLKHEIDTGDLLMQTKMEIGPDETTGEVHDRMMELGAKTMLESVIKIHSKDYELIPQDETKVSKAPKIFHNTCAIDFEKSNSEVHNFIRGLSPYPTAWTNIEEKKLKIFRSVKTEFESNSKPGTFVSLTKKRFGVVCEKGAILELLEVQGEGRKRMTALEFLNGQDISDFEKITINNI